MVRHKNRYIVVEIIEMGAKETVPLELKSDTIYNSIFQQVQRLHGDFGAAAIRFGFVAKYCNKYTKIAIVRCRHGPHKLVASSIPFIKTLDARQVKINAMYVGATIRQCFKFIKIYQEKKFDEFCVNLRTDESKDELRKAIMCLDTVGTIF